MLSDSFYFCGHSYFILLCSSHLTVLLHFLTDQGLGIMVGPLLLLYLYHPVSFCFPSLDWEGRRRSIAAVALRELCI